jgi:large exoprotein involved in heme utilization and adhesion
MTSPAPATIRHRRFALLAGTALQSAMLALVQPVAAQPAPSARPMGGQVTAGQASIAQSQAVTTVTQSSQRAAVDWRSFDVGRDHSVNFAQPSSSAITLNRVTGPDPSAIAGGSAPTARSSSPTRPAWCSTRARR